MNNILKLVNDSKNIAICGHVRPDGDCVGSVMALSQYLKKNLKDTLVQVYLEFVPESFLYIKGTDKIRIEPDNEVYDMFISLDCGSIDRLGPFDDMFKQAKNTLNIDHHISNEKFADNNFVDATASSTCEFLFSFMEYDRIDKDIAQAIYTGIIHDTGVFKHSNTTKKTLEIAGMLIDKGVPFSKIIDESFYQKTYIQNQILGRCLLESILVLDGKCIVSTVSKRIMEFYNANSKDLDGVIDQLRITKDVEVAILIHEINTSEYKVSMRSNNQVDVSKIAVYFGGGGHVKAAGCSMHGSIYDVINNLTLHIEHQLGEN